MLSFTSLETSLESHPIIREVGLHLAAGLCSVPLGSSIPLLTARARVKSSSRPLPEGGSAGTLSPAYALHFPASALAPCTYADYNSQQDLRHRTLRASRLQFPATHAALAPCALADYNSQSALRDSWARECSPLPSLGCAGSVAVNPLGASNRVLPKRAPVERREAKTLKGIRSGGEDRACGEIARPRARAGGP